MTLSLPDKDAIRDLVATYAHAVDRRRWDLIERLFHPEARFAFGPVQGGWREFVAQARAIIDPCIATHHQLGQVLIAPDGPDGAIAETYMRAMHTVPAGYPRSVCRSRRNLCRDHRRTLYRSPDPLSWRMANHPAHRRL